MSRRTRRLHSSPNGDHWILVCTNDSVMVRHEPNASSGGRASETTVGDFLVRGGHGPEKEELIRLIGTLADEVSDDV